MGVLYQSALCGLHSIMTASHVGVLYQTASCGCTHYQSASHVGVRSIRLSLLWCTLYQSASRMSINSIRLPHVWVYTLSDCRTRISWYFLPNCHTAYLLFAFSFVKHFTSVLYLLIWLKYLTDHFFIFSSAHIHSISGTSKFECFLFHAIQHLLLMSIFPMPQFKFPIACSLSRLLHHIIVWKIHIIQAHTQQW